MSGPDDILTICQICSLQMPMKDVFIVEDPFNKYFGLVTCYECFLPTNDQKKSYDVVDIPNIDVRKYRKRVFPDSFIYSEVNVGRAPSAPLNVRIQQNYQDGGLKLYWDPPDDTAGGITSYRVVRASPQFAAELTQTGYTGHGACWFKDLTADIDLDYSYRVYASNEYGESTASEYAFWRQRLNADVYGYLGTGDGDTLVTGDGDYLIIGGQ